MKEFTVSIDIAAPAERVFTVMTDVERWAEWTPSVTRIDRLDGGPFAVGSRVRVLQPKLPPAVWRVTEIVEGRGFTWVSDAPGIRVTAHHRVEPIGAGGRATLTIQYAGLFGPLLAWLTREINDRYLGLEARGLKARSEAAAATR